MAKKKPSRPEKRTLSRPEVLDAVLETVKNSRDIPQQQPHSLAEYTASKKLVCGGVIDPCYSALEYVYADFPDPERAYAEANSRPADREAIDTIEGERQHLNWVISGLLSLVSEAVEKGHGRNASRFAFEAGILWSMSNHAKVRRTASINQVTLAEAQRLAKLARTKEEERIAKLIRKEVAGILHASPVPMKPTSAREALARKSHFSDGTPMVCLTTIHNVFSPKRKPKNR